RGESLGRRGVEPESQVLKVGRDHSLSELQEHLVTKVLVLGSLAAVVLKLVELLDPSDRIPGQVRGGDLLRLEELTPGMGPAPHLNDRPFAADHVVGPECIALQIAAERTQKILSVFAPPP